MMNLTRETRQLQTMNNDTVLVIYDQEDPEAPVGVSIDDNTIWMTGGEAADFAAEIKTLADKTGHKGAG